MDILLKFPNHNPSTTILGALPHSVSDAELIILINTGAILYRCQATPVMNPLATPDPEIHFSNISPSINFVNGVNGIELSFNGSEPVVGARIGIIDVNQNFPGYQFIYHFDVTIRNLNKTRTSFDIDAKII